MSMQNGITEEEKFIQIYDELADSIFRHCYFRIYNYERAKELTQEAFTRAWEYIAKGKRIDNLKAFIYRIATNIIIDESRKKKAVSLDDLTENGFEIKFSGDNNIIIHAEAKIFLKHLNKLKEKERTLIVMRYLDDLQPREIAQILEKSENSISVGINRAIKKLKKYV